MRSLSDLETQLAFQIRALQLPAPQREYKFVRDVVGDGPGIRQRLKRHGARDWRFDFAWPAEYFACEVEGISPRGGRHQSVGGFRQDIEKYHFALYHGWIVYRTDKTQIETGEAVRLIKRSLQRIQEGQLHKGLI